jgi:hypothetical protein
MRNIAKRYLSSELNEDNGYPPREPPNPWTVGSRLNPDWELTSTGPNTPKLFGP